jgi:hypothetical protein
MELETKSISQEYAELLEEHQELQKLRRRMRRLRGIEGFTAFVGSLGALFGIINALNRPVFLFIYIFFILFWSSEGWKIVSWFREESKSWAILEEQFQYVQQNVRREDGP